MREEEESWVKTARRTRIQFSRFAACKQTSCTLAFLRKLILETMMPGETPDSGYLYGPRDQRSLSNRGTSSAQLQQPPRRSSPSQPISRERLHCKLTSPTVHVPCIRKPGGGGGGGSERKRLPLACDAHSSSSCFTPWRG